MNVFGYDTLEGQEDGSVLVTVLTEEEGPIELLIDSALVSDLALDLVALATKTPRR